MGARITRVRFAVLDLGSTSFQLLVAEANDSGDLVRVLRDRVILNLGMSLAGDHRIPPRQATQAIETVRRFRDLAERADADRILPIATSALRDATNREDLEGRLAAAAGAPIRFLDGAEEAALTVLGVRGCVGLPPAPFLVIDLGGGSLEIALADDGGVRRAHSFPLGAGRLTSQVVMHDPPARDERREVRSMVGDALGEVRRELIDVRPAVAVVSGGTPGAIGRLIAVDRWGAAPSSLNQLDLPVDELRQVARELGRSTLEERLRMPGIDERRAHVLPAGALVLSAVAETLGLPVLVLSEWGLREGVVLEAIGRTPSHDSPRELRAGSVESLANTWREDRGHPRHVASLAVTLFDALVHRHRLDPVDRELLGYAAMLHDIGVRVSPERHHKHGAYLVEHAGLRGFDPVEVALLACVVRFQKTARPSDSYPPYALLGPRERRRCDVLTGILRVAHALGRGSERDVQGVRVEDRPESVAIVVEGSGNPRGAAADASVRAELLTEALVAPVEVTVDGTAALHA